MSLVEAHFTGNLKNKMKMMIFKIYTKGGYLKEYNREFFYMKCAFMRNAAYYYNLFAMDV